MKDLITKKSQISRELDTLNNAVWKNKTTRKTGTKINEMKKDLFNRYNFYKNFINANRNGDKENESRN